MPLAQRDLDHVLHSVSDAWGELRGARIFVAGGAGFFGKWLVESFLHANRALDLNASMTVLSRNAASFARSRPDLADRDELEFRTGDVRDCEFPKQPYSHVLHLATPAAVSAGRGADLELVDTIVTGARRVLEFAARAGAARMLYASSGAVYGHQPPDVERLAETYPGAPAPEDPRAGYGTAKRLAEHLGAVFAAKTGLAFTVARCFAFVGPYLPLDGQFAVGNFIRDGLAGQTIRVVGDGTAYRSYLHAADLAAWLWTILTRGESCRPYNVGSETALTIAELAREVAGAFAPSPPVSVARAPAPGAAAARYVPCCARARNELGLDARIPLAEAIRRTVAWHQCALPAEAAP